MIPVTVKELSAALRQYDIKKRELDPARYEALADFRDFMPDLYPEMGPPPMNEDGTMKDDGPGGGPGGPPGMNEDLTRIMRALLSGDAVPNESMVKELGFTYDELQVTPWPARCWRSTAAKRCSSPRRWPTPWAAVPASRTRPGS